MKKTNVLLILGAVLFLAPVATSSAQSTWQTVADFQCKSQSAVDALTKDASGNLFAAVSTADPRAGLHAQIRKSTDHGATWTVVEDFLYGAPRSSTSTRFLSLGTDAAGHLYAVGYATDENGQTRWIVRKSGDSGNSWSTVDDFAWPGGQRTTAQGFAADAAGNLYVAGYTDAPTSDSKPGPRSRWLVRQSHDGGRNWSTIDDFGYGFSARAAAIVSTSSGLFLAGSGWNGKSESGERWLVRKGTVDGASGFRWQTVDEFQMKEHGHGYNSWAHGLGVDGQGNLYAVGRSYAVADGGISAHWIVRRASSAGSDWSVVDTFQLDPGSFAAAFGIAAGGQGGVSVVGQAAGRNPGPGSHWIVRQSATGDAGTWSVNDDFRLVTAPPSALETAALISKATDGIVATSPADISRGSAIFSDSTGLFAGGSASGELGHAIVRKLESSRASELAARRAP